MYEKNAIVNLGQGLHARPASEFVKKAGEFASQVTIVKAGKEANAKSILGVMGLAVPQGTEVTVRADGTDEVIAVDTLVEFLSKAD